jgi:hypothetical protein
MNPRYLVVAPRAAHRCEYCHAPECVFNFPFEVEHVIPEAHRGLDEQLNWALACRSCNLSKSNHVTGTDEATGSDVRLYHPRSDAWDDHFLADLASGEIQGKTAIGRATVGRLRMNSLAQLEARCVWMRLGLFPKCE